MWNTILDLGSQLVGVPRNLLLVGHCLFVASSCRASRSSFLLNYWAGFFCAFGGGITSGLLLQDPQGTPISLFAVNPLFFIWTVCWWLVNYSPGDAGLRLLQSFIFRLPCKVCVNILRTATILTRVDAGVLRYPGNVAAPLVLGALGGCGGKFLLDALYISAGLSSGPSELASPGYSWRSASMTAASYALSVHYLELFKPNEGKAAFTFFFVVHTILAELLKRPLDFTRPVAQALHRVTGIPDPAQQSQSKTSKAQKSD